MVQVFGVPKSVGQIYGLLFASPVALSFSDIVERLDISKGSASQGLQWLRSLGAINVADPVGDESQISNSESQIKLRGMRAAYTPELGLRRLVSGLLQERVAPLATTGADRLSKLRELAEQADRMADSAHSGADLRRLSSDVRNSKNFHIDRVRQLETWRRRLRTVLPVLSVLLGPKSRK